MKTEREGCIFYGSQEKFSVGKRSTEVTLSAQLFTRIPSLMPNLTKKDCAVDQKVREMIRRRSKKRQTKIKQEVFNLRCSACGYRGKCGITLIPAKSESNSL
jgi:hypothetical protein